MNEWRTIESYDALSIKNIPVFKVFYIAPGLNGNCKLHAFLSENRVNGRRKATHWMPLTEPSS